MGMTLNWNVRERLSVLRPRLFGRRVGCGDVGLLGWIGLVVAGGVFGCGQSTRLGAGLTHADTAVHSGRRLRWPIEICIARYHHCLRDMRFTDESNVTAQTQAFDRPWLRASPKRIRRRSIERRCAWHGGNEADYSVYRAETKAWRDAHLRVFPA